MAETTTKQVQFLTGSQERLNKLTSSINGAFYLTEDSHRLYVGTGNSAPVLLNQVVNVYNNISSLPAQATPNDFYYAKQENILCIYDPTSTPPWIQINPDTNTGYRNTEVTVNLLKDGDTGYSSDNVTYQLTITQKKCDEYTGAVDDTVDPIVLTTNIVLTADDISKIVPVKAEVGLSSNKETDGSIVISTSGSGSATENNSVTFKSGDGVSLDRDEAGVITISAPEQALSLTDDAKVTLSVGNGVGTTVQFVAGDDVSITPNTTDSKITISHKEYDSVTHTGKDPELSTSEIEYITGLTVSNGHITEITYGQHEDKDTTYTLSAGGSETDDKTSIILSDTNSTVSQKVDLTDIVNTITKDRFDKLSTALQYKGVTNEETAPKDAVTGDMWMVSLTGESSSTVYGVANCKSGDLLIYDGDSWERVPSGDELLADTQYENAVSYASNKFTQVIRNARTKVTSGTEFAITPGTDIDFNASGTISHKTYSAPSPSPTDDTSSEFTAITGITTSNGHITGYQTTKFVPDTYSLTLEEETIGDAQVPKISFKESGSWVGSDIYFSTDKILSVGKYSEGGLDIIGIQHAEPTKLPLDIVPESTLAHGSPVELYLPRFNSTGHYIGDRKHTLTLPEDLNTTYTLTPDTINNKFSLVGNVSTVPNGTVSFASSNTNLSITTTIPNTDNPNDAKLSLDLVWQSF